MNERVGSDEDIDVDADTLTHTDAEGFKVYSIPEDLTRPGFFHIMHQLDDGVPTGTVLAGELSSGPIEIGKPVVLGSTGCRAVKSIKREGGLYFITTVSGSVYRFDPSESVDTNGR